MKVGFSTVTSHSSAKLSTPTKFLKQYFDIWYLSKDASFFTHYYSHNVYSVKKLSLEAKNALER
jgi:hypothetical protein